MNAAGQAGADTWVLNNASADYQFGDLRVLQTNVDTYATTCLRNGNVEMILPVSMGKPGYETMTGTKLIMQKDFKTVMDSASYGVEDGPRPTDSRSTTPNASPGRASITTRRPGPTTRTAMRTSATAAPA